MSSLVILCPSMGGHEEAMKSWEDTMSKPWPIIVDANTEGDKAGFLSKCEAMRAGQDADILLYLHSDMFLLEREWDVRLLREFDDPKVAVAGFVGAKGLGHENIYKVGYQYTQLARSDVWSNLADAEVHGKRTTGSLSVAVLDSCAVAVRRTFLDRCGGWPVGRLPDSSHCSDLWICLMAHRAGYVVRTVGVGAFHRGGGKGEAGAKWLDGRGGDTLAHRRAHEVIYSEFSDVLPVRIS